MDEKKETARVEAFSDGVFAIAITLLVLELKPAIDHILESHPEVGLFGAMLEQWPIFLAFVTSFATLGIMWLNHHRLFNIIVRTDHNLLILNLFLLFAATVVPFPTALLGAYSKEPASFRDAVLLYDGVFLLVAIVYNVLWRYVTYRHRLLHRHVDIQAVRRIDRQYLFGPLLYAIAFVFAWISPALSLGIEALLAAFYLLPGVAWRRSDASQNSTRQEPRASVAGADASKPESS
ncbi:TMEM175 family protein [Ktedonospora formicarum]|uniref:DUF1211 domain-containing protein n=1 Tax=Ktedonospora formicarum TaxID=2778364 RepID=A0A8J3MXS1_9CHLR|nr:TMEM175 family protein [Ktedonospora formicarum]GHO50291.1 hypothetical protein KSX_84540 [Ktedonospora formicarum]